MVSNSNPSFPLILFLILISACSGDQIINRPNVIIVLTDDQGIGDLSCHGNPWLKTPNLDAFYEESVSLTDFHVSPLCTPTRSAIITGRYPIRNGAWATFKGRDAITDSSPTMADVFKDNGYSTALFGKWHLGDNYPARPTDCGFDHAVHHSSGGVSELSDYWGNDYFDDVYLGNNEPKQFEGYCTDVWFTEALKYIDQVKESPFFVYLSTNAPHAPLIVADEYKAPYKALEGEKIQSAAYLGMIANIDKNFGRLDRYLKENGLDNNTILIFLTDNGTQFGYSADGKLGYNKGFRGNKSDKEEGGHRVPFFIRWPNAGIEGRKDINLLTTHVDLIPTLAGLCDLSIPENSDFDGLDYSDILLGKGAYLGERTVFIHHRQDWRAPFDVENTCIMKGKWRLLNGVELYDVEKDPIQKNNLISEHKELVKTLLKQNLEFLKKTKQLDEYKNLPVSKVGTPHQKEIKLTIQHAIGEDAGIWKSEHIAEGVKNGNNQYAIELVTPGKYSISCRRWPKECPGPILGIPKDNPKNQFDYKSIKPEKAMVKIFDQVYEREILEDHEVVDFVLDLPAGRTMLETSFVEKGSTYGVYYTYIGKPEE